MNEIVLLVLKHTPPPPEFATELVAAGTLTASGGRAVWQAAGLAFRAVSEGVRGVRGKQEYRDFEHPEFEAIMNADPRLLELARGNRGVGRQAARLERNRNWAAGGQGIVTRSLERLRDFVLWPAALVWSLRDAAKRRKGGSK